MRRILIAAAAVAASGFIATAATAQNFEPGGQERIGSMCKVVTDTDAYPYDRHDEMYGYYAPCDTGAYDEAPVVRHH